MPQNNAIFLRFSSVIFWQFSAKPAAKLAILQNRFENAIETFWDVKLYLSFSGAPLGWGSMGARQNTNVKDFRCGFRRTTCLNADHRSLCESSVVTQENLGLGRGPWQLNLQCELLRKHIGYHPLQESPRQTKPKKGQFMNFSRARSGTKVRYVNRACFAKEKHQNSQKWAKFMNFSFWPFSLVWFAGGDS